MSAAGSTIGHKSQPVVAAGADGSAIQLLKRLTLQLDTAGVAQQVEGQVADGGLAAGINPVLIAGLRQSGTTIDTLSTDSTFNLRVRLQAGSSAIGTTSTIAADSATLSANALVTATQVFAFDATGNTKLRCDTTGTLRVGKYRTTVSSVPVVGTGTVYASGDAIGGVTTASGVFRVANGGAVLKGVAISNKNGVADIAIPVRIWFFNASPASSTLTDNNAMSIVDADVAKVLGYVEITTGIATPGGLNEIWFANGLDIQLVGASGGTGLHYCLESRGAIAANASASDWTVNLYLEQE